MTRRPKLKKLSEQVIVLTGATSGVGLATARLAAKHGARLVLVARNEDALDKLTNELNTHGTRAVSVTADVGKEEDVRKIVDTAQEQFGGFDTWINNAAVSMFGRLMDVPMEDERQLFETNYWGVVNGSRAAVEHLRFRGGALINVGSANSDYAAPLQGTFSASKHAVKGYTDALRMELKQENAPVSVTLVKPSPLDTPYAKHARNYLEQQPKQTPPAYDPEVAAETILFCAEHPRRDIYVGGAGKFFSSVGRLSPTLSDIVVGALSFRMQKTGKRAKGRTSDSLYTAGSDMHEHGDYQGHVMKSSAYTSAAKRSAAGSWLLLAAGVLAGMWWHTRRTTRSTSARRLSRQGEQAMKSVPKIGRSLERKMERKSKQAAQAIPRMAKSARRSIERNVPGL